MKDSRGRIRRLAVLVGAAAVAFGRVVVGIGVPFGWYGAPWFYGPPVYPYWQVPPVYIAPPAYAPPPVQYLAPPVQSAPPPSQFWYYCKHPKGYYPYVNACPGGWQQVSPRPAG